MAVTVKDLVNHPYSFALGVGLANGFLAIGRGKKIDPPTAITLSLILGLGEMALVMYEPESERPMSLTAVGVYSVLGVLTGLMPFVSKSVVHGGGTMPIAERESGGGFPLIASAQTANANSAVSGWGGARRASPVRRRRYA